MGNVFVWAAGNGGIKSDSCSCDGYASSIYTISIAAMSERDTASWYVEYCASTLVATYSSGDPSIDRNVSVMQWSTYTGALYENMSSCMQCIIISKSCY